MSFSEFSFKYSGAEFPKDKEDFEVEVDAWLNRELPPDWFWSWGDDGQLQLLAPKYRNPLRDYENDLKTARLEANTQDEIPF